MQVAGHAIGRRHIGGKALVLALFALLSRRNSDNARAIFQFNARQYNREGTDAFSEEAEAVTTLAQVKQVTRPLLERNSDLALVGRLVVMKPVRHLIRGVLIDRSPDPVIHKLVWFVNFLFKPWTQVSDRWGERLFDKRGVSVNLDDPATILTLRERIPIMAAQLRLPVRERRYPESWGGWVSYDPTIATEICEVIEEQALPMLRAVQSIDDFVAFAADQTRFAWTYLGPNYSDEPFVFAAQGNLEAALAACTRLVQREPAGPRVRELLRRLAGGDRLGVAQLLHDWEAASVKQLKLEQFWQPTPFPIEAAA